MKDPGSFRDPSGFIFIEKNKIFRVINESYKENFQHFISSGLYDVLLKKQLIVEHRHVKKNIVKQQYRVLEVQSIFPITYPYEWSFSQYKDAALLTLKIQKIAIKYGMTLKDATPYNVQFNGHKAIFIDTLSFEKIINENYTWLPYKQFCEMFLGPLSLMSYVNPDLNKLMIAYIDGLPLSLINNLFKIKHKFIPSIFIHFVLPNVINSRVNLKTQSLKKIITKKQHLNIVEQLLSFINKLEVLKEQSEWGEYNTETISEKKNYVYEKENTIERFLKNNTYKTVWDIGANDGFYSRKVAELTKSQVIALDIDWKCVEKNYVINYKKGINNVVPILFDISNPSPGVGWLNNERKDLFSRIGPPDLICLFAVMHHILNRNIPIDLLFNFIEKTKSDALIEYVPFSDPKCKIIFNSRPKDFYYPSQDDFEKKINKNFRIIEMKKLTETNRILYFIKKK